MGLFTPVPDNLSGISCSACKEDKVVHNTARNRACTEQLRKPIVAEIKALKEKGEPTPITLINKLRDTKNFN
jgi:hypothetical protein